MKDPRLYPARILLAGLAFLDTVLDDSGDLGLIDAPRPLTRDQDRRLKANRDLTRIALCSSDEELLRGKNQT